MLAHLALALALASLSSSAAGAAPRSRPLTAARGLLYQRGAASASAAAAAAASTRSAAAAAAAAPPALRVDDEGESWPTEHHDARNSGYTSLYRGPSDAAGICRAQFFKDSPIDPAAVRFYSVGVNNVLATDNVFMFGGTDNVLRVIKGDVTATVVDEWSCDLDNLSPGRATAFGVVASGTVWNTSATSERLAIASGNGFVYALNFEQ